MFVKKINNGNKTHLYLVESYRLNGKTKHRTIKSLGILEELQKDNPDTDVIQMLNNQYKNIKGEVTIDFDNVNTERTDVKNYGYYILEAIYEKLGINKFLKNFQNSRKTEFDLDRIMKLLVFSRILFPGSKLKTLNRKDIYFEAFDVSLNDIYRSLDLFDVLKDDLQLDIHENIINSYGRDCTLVFYNVTNYYFGIHENDTDKVDEQGKVIEGFRRKGLGKDGKRQPLVVMGLAMDKNSIPVAYKLFKGNEADTKTMIPIFKEISKKYNLQRIILVADKGINSENNLNYMVNEGNGYILSQKARRQSKKFTEEILKQDNYITESKNFKYKSIVRRRKLECKEDKTKDIEIDEKVVFFWSRDFYNRAKHKRDAELEKIQHFIKNQKVLVKIEKDLKPYIMEKVKDKKGKEIKDAEIEYEFNEEKFKESCRLDGYYIIISSETNLTEKEIIEKYRGLSEIENCFRILKSDFDDRPIHVRNKSRIEGHFLICFVSLVIMRVLQNLTGRKYTVENLSEAINSATLKPFQKDILLFNKTKDTYTEIEKMFGINNNFSNLRCEHFKEYKKNLFDYIKRAVFY